MFFRQLHSFRSISYLLNEIKNFKYVHLNSLTNNDIRFLVSITNINLKILYENMQILIKQKITGKLMQGFN